MILRRMGCRSQSVMDGRVADLCSKFQQCLTGRKPLSPGKDTMRKLTLKKETFSELSTSELTDVVGGYSGVKYCETITCQWSYVDTCITWHCTR